MKVKTTQKFKSSPKLLAARLNALFTMHNLNASQVARALGIPMMTIRRLISGETVDPRISTLKLIADHFHVSIDSLLNEEKLVTLQSLNNTKPHFVPVLDWTTPEKMKSIRDIDLSNWEEWQAVSLSEQNNIGKNAFALESRPSMYPRFPQGTLFIVDPETDPEDGDVALIKIKKNNELTLRELSIDPPEWQLHPIVPGSKVLSYNQRDFEIVGITLLTLLYHRRKHS